MKIFLIFVLALLSINCFSQKNFIDSPYIETSATADTLVLADEIHLNIIISERDTKDKISVEELENVMDQKLKAIGIDVQKQLTINDIASNFKKYFIKDKDVMKTKSYNLVVYNAVTAGKVISELESIEISNIKVAKLVNSQYQKIKLLMKSKAVSNAKINAEYLVQSIKQKVGNAIYITDVSDFNNNFVNNDQLLESVVVQGYKSKKVDNLQPIDIEFKKIKIKIESKVSVRFKLE